jgi:hypothetical protein
MANVSASEPLRGVGEPCSLYDSIAELWKRSRAVCSGERYVKDYDSLIDTVNYTNLLIPFSPNMTPQQYEFYKSEAELPGIVSTFAKFIVGGLLRKQPHLKLPEKAPEEAQQWILDAFTSDGQPLAAFLDGALWEEVQTSRTWIYVDYPVVPANHGMTNAELIERFAPFPIVWPAESIINWRTEVVNGKSQLTRVIVKGHSESFTKNEFHPEYIETVWVHELLDGKYQIRVFQAEVDTQAKATGGSVSASNGKNISMKLKDTITGILMNNKPLDFIPAWPLNGCIDPIEPSITPLVDKEINLYNKMSRRNHLIYGAATYTPVISTDMVEEEFDKIVDSGLGTWIKLNRGDTADVLKTPTEALKDMEATIASAIDEMARLGVRMLTPEVGQSGIALDIRNASQTAQLGTMNTKVSNTLADIIAFMLNWRYGTDFKSSDVEFNLSADFNPAPLGDAWLRLVTEWYKEGLIPRSTWLAILKQNDIVPPDYDDETAQEEINADEFIVSLKKKHDAEASRAQFGNDEQPFNDKE